ncbi:hypothetical protein J2S20_001287 [Moryella indoligenes]|uniref:Uncharacterized protein n=1 Tax=Moryella indoligenes TaxID=371674 RepID=A0AAE3VAB6_9FIRM|nr:hypothetical protein [Moryella indoligenes]
METLVLSGRKMGSFLLGKKLGGFGSGSGYIGYYRNNLFIS